MADNCAGRFSVVLLADRIDLVAVVAEIRWREWGHRPEPQALSWWVDAARREAGREELPVTLVATKQGRSGCRSRRAGTVRHPGTA